jgi:hypothetical protein
MSWAERRSMNLITLIWQFFLTNYLVNLLVVALGNVIAGTTAATVNDKFSWPKAKGGLLDLLALAIGYLTLGVFAYSVKDVTFEDIQIFNSLFKFLTILVIAIKGNSLAMHYITLAKIPVPAVMVTIDNKIKSLLGKENPDVFGITEDEGEVLG